MKLALLVGGWLAGILLGFHVEADLLPVAFLLLAALSAGVLLRLAGGVAAARRGIASLSLFDSRQTAGDELAHLRDFRLGEQLDGGGFVGCDDWLSGVPV